LTVSIAASTGASHLPVGPSIFSQTIVGHSISYALWLLLPGIVIVCGAAGRRPAKRRARVFGLTALLLLVLSLLSCGGVSNGGTTSTSTSGQPTIYQIVVTGTSPGTTPDAGQSAVVALVLD
jgi:Trk-type K+ transport system membrane component